MDTIWTIGHSNRSWEEFLELLTLHGIELIADVRSHPGSRKYPYFSRDALMANLPKAGVDYVWLSELGGRRRARPDSPNTVWRNASFRGYADYMETAAFQHGLEQLLSLAQHARVAVMCAEAVWWRCHRSMIADALCAQGVNVQHILNEGDSKPHPMTGPARVVNGRLTYVSDP